MYSVNALLICRLFCVDRSLQRTVLCWRRYLSDTWWWSLWTVRCSSLLLITSWHIRRKQSFWSPVSSSMSWYSQNAMLKLRLLIEHAEANKVRPKCHLKVLAHFLYFYGWSYQKKSICLWYPCSINNCKKISGVMLLFSNTRSFPHNDCNGLIRPQYFHQSFESFFCKQKLRLSSITQWQIAQCRYCKVWYNDWCIHVYHHLRPFETMHKPKISKHNYLVLNSTFSLHYSLFPYAGVVFCWQGWEHWRQLPVL